MAVWKLPPFTTKHACLWDQLTCPGILQADVGALWGYDLLMWTHSNGLSGVLTGKAYIGVGREALRNVSDNY